MCHSGAHLFGPFLSPLFPILLFLDPTWPSVPGITALGVGVWAIIPSPVGGPLSVEGVPIPHPPVHDSPLVLPRPLAPQLSQPLIPKPSQPLTPQVSQSPVPDLPQPLLPQFPSRSCPTPGSPVPWPALPTPGSQVP